MLIGITGTLGAGKGAAVDYLVTKKNYRHVSARAIWTKELNRYKHKIKSLEDDIWLHVDGAFGGAVIFRGSIPTRRSYTENIVDIHNESNPYLAKIILKYTASNHLPTAEEKFPYSGHLWSTPSVMQSIIYLFQIFFLFASLVIERLILRKDNRWGVAFIGGSWENANLRKGIQIKNPPNHFLADPFVITKKNRTICFVEDYCYKEKRALIAAIEIIDQKQYKLLGPVIQEP